MSPKERLAAWILLAAVCLVYGACAVFPYALCDDYGQMIFLQNGKTDWLTNPLSKDGRPITSFFVCEGFKLVGCLDNLRILRALAFVGALGFTFYIFRHFLRFGLGLPTAFALACVTIFSPGMGEYIGWTVSWPFMPLLLAVAWMSAWFCEKTKDGASAGKTLLACVVAVAGLQIVMLTYQPVAGFFVMIPFVWLYGGKMRPALFSIPVLAASFAVYRFASFPALALLHDGWGVSTRASLTNDIVGHLGYMLGHFSTFCAASWSVLLLPHGGWTMTGCVILALAAAGCVAVASYWRGVRFFISFFVIAGLFAISAPQIFLLDDVWAFRTHAPMTVLIGMLAVIGLLRLAKLASRMTMAAFVSVILIVCAAWSVNVGIVYSSVREYSILQKKLVELKESGANTARVLIAPANPNPQPPIPLYWRSCYGFISIILENKWQALAVAHDVWQIRTDEPYLTFINADRLDAVPTSDEPVLDLWGEISGKPTPVTTLSPH